MTATPRRGGRPTKRTEERETLILPVLRAGGTIAGAAGHAEVSESQLYRWMKADARFRHDVTLAEADAEVRFSTVIAEGAFGRPAQYDDATPDPGRAASRSSPRHVVARTPATEGVGEARRRGHQRPRDAEEIVEEADRIARGMA